MTIAHSLGSFVDKTKQVIKRIPHLNQLTIYVYKHVKRQHGMCRLQRLKNTRPLRLVVGASGVYGMGWINTDVEYLDLLNKRHWEVAFHRNSIDAILAEHVWEHLTPDEGLEAAERCFEYLRPGGYLRVAVPDGWHPDPGYIEHVRPGGSGPGAADHKVLYNYSTFSAIFEKAGFRVVPLEWYDCEREFHYVSWNTQEGKIWRSRRYDERNKEGIIRYTSLIIDARKDV